MSDVTPQKRHPKWVRIRWRQEGDGDDVRCRERPMREGVEPLREARSLAQAAGVPKGTLVVYAEQELVGSGSITTATGRRYDADAIWLTSPEQEFRWEHGV